MTVSEDAFPGLERKRKRNVPDAEVAQALIRIARPMYASEDLGLDLDNTVFALDASTIDLCLSMFPWAPFQSTKAAVKLHTLLDLRGPIPTFLHVSDGKMADVHALDRFVPEPGAFYVMDRAYLDFERLYALAAFGAFFVIRAKSNTVLDSCRRRVGADNCPVRPVALDSAVSTPSKRRASLQWPGHVGGKWLPLEPTNASRGYQIRPAGDVCQVASVGTVDPRTVPA